MRRFACATALLGLLLANCGGNNSGDVDRAPTLRIAIEANPRSLDPRLSTDAVSSRLQQLMFNGLVRVDEHSRIVPDLASAWDQPDDLTYVFHLRRGVRFHHGRELTSDDVMFTFNSILDPALKSPRRAGYDMIESVTAPDPATVAIHLKKPFAPLLINMTQAIVPLDLASEPGFPENPSGTGPYRLESLKRDVSVTLARVDGRADAQPYFAKIIARIIPEPGIRLLELEKGSVQFVQNDIQADAVPRLQQDPNLTVVTWPGTNYSYLGFNLRDPALANKEVRQAIALAINRDGLIRDVLGGLARPALGMLPEEHWAFAAEVRRFERNLAQAQRLLDAAGYPQPADGGPRITLSYKTSTNELSRRLAEAMQQDLAEAGIAVTIRSFEWATFYEDILRGNFQLYSLNWVGVQDPDMLRAVFHTNSVPPNGRNRGGYSNPNVDTLLDQAAAVYGEPERAKLYREAQTILAEDVPYVSLWHQHHVAVMSRDLTGFSPHPAGDFSGLLSLRPEISEQTAPAAQDGQH